MKLTRRTFLKAATLGGLGLGGMSSLTATPDGRRPNVLLILADDMGYSDASCYGGEIETPNLAALAANGLRFTQHYSTGRCWPSRACILSGYYAQHIRRDTLPGTQLGKRPSWAVLLPEMLKPHGYRSYHSGKWHIDGTPQEGGFDRSWGRENVGCDYNRYFDSQPWKEDGATAPVEVGKPYYSTIAIADHAIQCLKLHHAQWAHRPFFQYVAFYAPHFPLHALQQDIDRYRETYLEGWDSIRRKRWQRMREMGLVNCALSDRDPVTIPSWNLPAEQLAEKLGSGEAPRAVAWDGLTDEQKRFQATKMAIHAAMITRMDAEIGRIVQQLRDMGALENTLILFASDNGASAEQIIRGDGHDPNAPAGSAKTFLCLGPGWSTATNTPFRLHKHWNHEGGISSPLIVHWPAGIAARNELRHDPCHFIDIVPTVLDVAGADRPRTPADQAPPPAPGRSLVSAFAGGGAVEHPFLWWAHSGHRAIRVGDWKLSAVADGPWELYDLKTDRCEMNDLAGAHPQRVSEMADLWEQTARRFRDDLKN